MSCELTLPVRSKPCSIQELVKQSKDIENYDELNEGLNDFMKKVYPKVEVLEYTLRFLSSCLSGEIQEEKDLPGGDRGGGAGRRGAGGGCAVVVRGKETRGR